MLKDCVNCGERIARYPCPFCKYDPDSGKKKDGKESEENKKFPWLFVGAGVVLLISSGVFGSFTRVFTGEETDVVAPVTPVGPDITVEVPDGGPMSVDDIEISPAVTSIRLDADELWSEYAVNPELADENYKGRTAAVIGRATHIEVGKRNVIRMDYTENESAPMDGAHEVVAFVRAQDSETIKEVAKGDLVIVVCTVAGLIDGVPVLDNCTFVR